jgi:hypothetical protein
MDEDLTESSFGDQSVMIRKAAVTVYREAVHVRTDCK